jgi:hypothetical protein
MSAEDYLVKLIVETDAPLAEAEAERQRVDDRIASLKAERYGLELALARIRGVPKPPPPGTNGLAVEGVVPEEVRLWRSRTRLGAVERVLRESGPIHRKDLHARLLREGRNDTIVAVSAALSHLHRQDRAVSLGNGMWTHPGLSTDSAASEDRAEPDAATEPGHTLLSEQHDLAEGGDGHEEGA